TKTEQGDLWQMLGAAFGDYPRVIAAPLDIGDCFKLIPEIFNIADRFQCPGLVLCDLLLSEGRLSVHPKDLDFRPTIDRGELITSTNGVSPGIATNGDYKRYRITKRDRKSTRLNSSHVAISYAVFCLKKKNKINI